DRKRLERRARLGPRADDDGDARRTEARFGPGDDVRARRVELVRVVPHEDAEAIVGQALEHAQKAAAQRGRDGQARRWLHRAELAEHRGHFVAVEPQRAQPRFERLYTLLRIAVARAGDAP